MQILEIKFDSLHAQKHRSIKAQKTIMKVLVAVTRSFIRCKKLQSLDRRIMTS